jgi:uncharacterized alkaline shock family protein YloU
MRFLGIIFYAAVIILVGAVLISGAVLFSLPGGLIQQQDIINLVSLLQNSFSTRLVIGFSGLLLILISIFLAQQILGRFQREKTIAFATASGEVTVSLNAVEDLIKRLAGVIPEIRELRPDVIAKKGTIMVDLRVILRSEANIPELTARLQDITRLKIQEVLGLEEQIIIKIHIAKIVAQEDKEKKKKEAEKQEAILPYGGYGRV